MLKNLNMQSLVHFLGVRLRPLGSLNPHTNAALLGKIPPSPSCFFRALSSPQGVELSKVLERWPQPA